MNGEGGQAMLRMKWRGAITLTTGLMVTGGLLVAGPVAAADFPKRKPGLWSMRTSGGPFGGQTMEQCIDAKTDDLLRVESAEGQTCGKPVVTRDGGRYRVRLECQGDGRRQVMTGVYTMKDDTGYSGDMQMRFTPAMEGVSEMNMKVDGRWLGACKPGMKPGDIAIQGMGSFNPLDAARNAGQGAGGLSAEDLKKATEAMMKQLQQKQ